MAYNVEDKTDEEKERKMKKIIELTNLQNIMKKSYVKRHKMKLDDYLNP